MKSMDGDEMLARELVDLFIASGDETLAAIVDALGMRDYAAVGAQAHSLKGASANLRATATAQAAAELEAAARSGDGAANRHAGDGAAHRSHAHHRIPAPKDPRVEDRLTARACSSSWRAYHSALLHATKAPRVTDSWRASTLAPFRSRTFLQDLVGEPRLEFRQPHPGGRRLVAHDLARALAGLRGARAGLHHPADHAARAAVRRHGGHLGSPRDHADRPGRDAHGVGACSR